MKYTFIFLFSLFALSCETIRVNVQAKKETASEINRHSPLHFLATDQSAEATQLRRQCKRGVIFAGLKVEEDCDATCRYVTFTTSSSEVDAGLRQKNLSVSVFSDREMQKRIYQASVSTTNEKGEVITELCEAAFQAYPDSLNNEIFNIQSRAP